MLDLTAHQQRIVVMQWPMASFDGESEGLSAWLSDDERRQLNRFRTSRRRKAFLAGRYVTRQLIARMLGVQPRDVAIDLSPGGKPQLTRPVGDLHFNISHSEFGIAVGVNSVGLIGVDTEWLDVDLNQRPIAENYFTQSERDQCSRFGVGDSAGFFYRLWTCKEAAWKLVGERSVLASDIQVELIDDHRSRIHIASRSAPRRTLAGFTWRSGSQMTTAAVSWPRIDGAVPSFVEWNSVDDFRSAAGSRFA